MKTISQVSKIELLDYKTDRKLNFLTIAGIEILSHVFFFNFFSRIFVNIFYSRIRRKLEPCFVETWINYIDILEAWIDNVESHQTWIVDVELVIPGIAYIG